MKQGDEDIKAARPLCWHLETTEQQLRRIREARAARGEQIPWIKHLEDALAEKRAQMPARAS